MLLTHPHHSRTDVAEKRSFAHLMWLYEQNYIRLRHLLPDLAGMPMVSRSVRTGCLDLHLTIIERTPYTTILRLTYRFHTAAGVLVQPDLKIRIYHDAQVAEVVTGFIRKKIICGEKDVSIQPLTLASTPMNLPEKWQVNRFLYKWLGYCLQQGHCFRAYSVA